jgi:hypothetical protein
MRSMWPLHSVDGVTCRSRPDARPTFCEDAADASSEGGGLDPTKVNQGPPGP